ncbi:MAG TPA: carbon storage regulator [Pirellulaceae bacterium]|nr:carbon storage regulator [Pirellulaceae bacterium]
MLVLSRKENEVIIINGDIRITIVRSGRGKVKLGIQAPDEVSIMRSELEFLNERPADFPPYNAVGANYVHAHHAMSPGT